jgi:hypothetical protein
MVTRMEDAKTPWARIAIAFESHVRMIRNEFRKTGAGPQTPDYADLTAMLEPYVKRELLLVRIDEARKVSGMRLTDRIEELAKELGSLEASIPPELRL